MFSLAILFWIALVVPGYALVRRIWPEDIKSGLLGTVGLSYVAVLGALSPISILCYVCHLPLAVLSGSAIAMMIAGAIDVTRNNGWREAGKLVTAAVGVGLFILIVHLIGSAYWGGFLHGDSRVHLARIRYLLDNGLCNDNPYAGSGSFMAIYHTNLLHALHAAACQVTGSAHMLAWMSVLPWAQLMIASGAYYLAWSVYNRQWVGWIAAAFVIGNYGPVTFAVYPNHICPFALFPFLMAFVVQAATSRPDWRVALKISMVCLLLGQIHGLYAIFALLVIGPTLVWMFVRRLVRRQPGRIALAVACAALCGAMVFPVISKANSPNYEHRKQEPAAAKFDAGSFYKFSNGWFMRVPSRDFGPGGYWAHVLVASGAVCALLSARRRQATVVLAIMGTALAIFIVPPLCTLVWRTLGQHWIFTRMNFVVRYGFIMMVPCAFGFFLIGVVQPILQRRINGGKESSKAQTRKGNKKRNKQRGSQPAQTRSARVTLPFALAQSVLLLGALALGTVYAPKGNYAGWNLCWQMVRTHNKEKRTRLHRWQGLRDFLGTHVPKGDPVLTPGELGVLVVMLHDCSVVAPSSCGNGIPDFWDRQAALKRMLTVNAPWDEVKPLLQEYGITWVLPNPRAVPRWLIAHHTEHQIYTYGRSRYHLFAVDAG